MSRILSNGQPPRPSSKHDSTSPPDQERSVPAPLDDSSPPEPFPAFDSTPSFQHNASLPILNTISPPLASPSQVHSPLTGLRLQTEHLARKNKEDSRARTSSIPESPSYTIFNAGLPVRNTSVRSTHSARQPRRDSLSPGSASSSPAIGPLVEMTPLPSPISAYGSPAQWRRSMENADREPAESLSPRTSLDLARTPSNVGRHSPKKRKIPVIGDRLPDTPPDHINANATSTGTRSISEYVPEGLQAPRSRNIVVSTSATGHPSPPDESLHREQCLAVQRGLIPAKLPTPPISNAGSEDHDVHRSLSPPSSKAKPSIEYEATSLRSERVKQWQAIRQLGEGQFSKVMLATKDSTLEALKSDEKNIEAALDPRSCVAIKICNHGPAGGADEKSIETSIKRELDLMKAIDHPSLIHLKAVNQLPRQTLFVLNYCPGGDLFELASTNMELLKPDLVQRIFSELVCAVLYLHQKFIVHRDIKLENILVNIKASEIREINDWRMYQWPVVVLSDLGLGREIPKPPEAPLLKRRCGSEDYAAPEVLMGQDYDGRSTDAWALGVVLYTMMEGRMPFDPVPGSRRRAPTGHKIARCEWQWVKFADSDGDWDPEKGRSLEGAREIVEGLLVRTRSRWSLEKVEGTKWVREGIDIPGGLRRGDDEV